MLFVKKHQFLAIPILKETKMKNRNFYDNDKGNNRNQKKIWFSYIFECYEELALVEVNFVNLIKIKK